MIINGRPAKEIIIEVTVVRICPDCEGYGIRFEDRRETECGTCDGDGVVRRKEDMDIRGLAAIVREEAW